MKLLLNKNIIYAVGLVIYGIIAYISIQLLE